MSLSKSALIPGGSDSLVYTILLASVGMLVPFTSMENHDLFQHLEMHHRGENLPLCQGQGLMVSLQEFWRKMKEVYHHMLWSILKALELEKGVTQEEIRAR